MKIYYPRQYLIILSTIFLSAVSSIATADSTAVFNYTGGQQSWVVPAGVTSIEIQAKGAKGGGSNGGKGARATGTYSVTPGETLYIRVGGQGVNNGGYNGGGARSQGYYYHGFGGGGASDVRQGGTIPANRIIVGAGGGGASHTNHGGNGGAPNGANGGGSSAKSRVSNKLCNWGLS